MTQITATTTRSSTNVKAEEQRERAQLLSAETEFLDLLTVEKHSGLPRLSSNIQQHSRNLLRGVSNDELLQFRQNSLGEVEFYFS